MVSFHRRLSAGLAGRGYTTTDELEDDPVAAVLVIGGTRQLNRVWRARRRGARIVQRLDGMNWLHRLRPIGLRHWMRAEYGNLLLAFIRARLADFIVYQSEFSRRWWERVRGPSLASNSVVYNGVDLAEFSPQGAHERPGGRCRVLLVEASLMGGYESGLETAVDLADYLAQRLKAAHSQSFPRGVELVVAGRVALQVRARWEKHPGIHLIWAGLVPPERIPHMDRSAHMLFSADINAACPNAVVEALACGLPVLAFDTGALPEMVVGDAGRVVPYGSDPWRLQPADIPALGEAALEISLDQARFRSAARTRAEAAFGLDAMLNGYLGALLPA